MSVEKTPNAPKSEKAPAGTTELTPDQMDATQGGALVDYFHSATTGGGVSNPGTIAGAVDTFRKAGG